MDKVFFTLEEAQGCVNWLKEQFEAIKSLRNKIDGLDQKIQTLESGVSLTVEVPLVDRYRVTVVRKIHLLN